MRQGDLKSFLELAQQLGISGLMEEEPHWQQESGSTDHSKVNLMSNTSNHQLHNKLKMLSLKQNTQQIALEEKGIWLARLSTIPPSTERVTERCGTPPLHP